VIAALAYYLQRSGGKESCLSDLYRMGAYLFPLRSIMYLGNATILAFNDGKPRKRFASVACASAAITLLKNVFLLGRTGSIRDLRDYKESERVNFPEMERGMLSCVRVFFFMTAIVEYTLSKVSGSHLLLGVTVPQVEFSSPSSSGYSNKNLPYEGQYYTRRHSRSSFR